MAHVLAPYADAVAAGALAPDPAQQEAAARLEDLRARLEAWRPRAWFAAGAPRGLYIWGAVGRGKSLLMDMFFEIAPVARKRRVHFHEFMLAQHDFMRQARARRDNAQDQLIHQAAKAIADRADLLCFDELQVTDIADAMILGRLFEDLFTRRVVIVATSNRAPDDLYKNGINRQLFLPFIGLMKEKLDVLELSAARDYRLEKLMAAPTYYTPLGPAADEAMDRAWARLASGAKPRPVMLDVQGRRLDAPRTAAGVARFTFEELCARPLGAADYIELAARFHTLMIDRAPKMKPALREEAARFRTLIDELYQAKTKLVISADAPPAALYPQGDQSFEFERTVSRLMEMQSADYLGAEHAAESEPA
ncbi:MAG TPA: cell division protein ZapE [Caulobacterales bacterium]|jgi:cell division protein ZapE|nr:cell division protein ZapE [Caulobacterales bacterium]